MLQCSECEYFYRGPDGKIGFQCDPFSTIKEPECLTKWQLVKMSEMTGKVQELVEAYNATLSLYKRLGPLQERMLKHMERELDEAEEADSWKFVDDDEDDDDDTDDDESPWTAHD